MFLSSPYFIVTVSFKSSSSFLASSSVFPSTLGITTVAFPSPLLTFNFITLPYGFSSSLTSCDITIPAVTFSLITSSTSTLNPRVSSSSYLATFISFPVTSDTFTNLCPLLTTTEIFLSVVIVLDSGVCDIINPASTVSS